ncbi:MAG: 6-hydroxymethylpterin diphosphokinase MptE-like protein [Crocinitomicaceae bacterium]|nr:DUF115 domain-containing protein [Crocinitomicaceae bacterium]
MIKKIAKKLIPNKFLEQPGFRFGWDKENIAALKDKFKGERCFIVGNGPSLNLLDLSKLKEEYSFAVNGIFYKTWEMGYKPTFYVVEDRHVMADNIDEINKYDCDYKFFPSAYKKQITNFKNVYLFNMDVGFYVEGSKHFEKSRFSKDASEVIFCGQSVTFINLQLAYYLGFSEVYLIGMDFNYTIPDSVKKIKGAVIESTEDDVNHFHPDYFGKGKKWHDPKLHNVLQSYKLHKKMFEEDGRKIFNATAGGKLEEFDRVDFDSLF